jgi:hypothetical protein
MDEHGRTLGRPFEGRDHRCQHIVVGVLNGREVVATLRHWSRSCEKVKGEFDGDQLVQRFPLNPFRSSNHIATRLILLTQPLLIRPTRPTSSPATRVVFVMSF